MKKLLITCVVATAFCGAPAFAADMAVKAPPPAAPVYSWTGFYGGISLGAMTTNDPSFVGSPLSGNPGIIGAVDAGVSSASSLSGSGTNSPMLIAGGQIGYNWRLYQRTIVGLETDISAVSKNSSSLNGSVPVPHFPTIAAVSSAVNNSPYDYFGTVRARFGYLLTDAVLVYATGGLAYARVNSGATITSALVNSAALGQVVTTIGGSSLRTGYTVGGGLEDAISRHVSLKVEGLYYDLGTRTDSGSFSIGSAGGIPFYTTGVTKTESFRGAVVRVGMNYLF